jgi:hypothetical protein
MTIFLPAKDSLWNDEQDHVKYLTNPIKSIFLLLMMILSQFWLLTEPSTSGKLTGKGFYASGTGAYRKSASRLIGR